MWSLCFTGLNVGCALLFNLLYLCRAIGDVLLSVFVAVTIIIIVVTTVIIVIIIIIIV